MKLLITPAFLVLLSLLSLTMADDSSVKQITTGNNKLNNKLYNEVLVEKPGENLIMSPISVHTILSLVQQGAESQTAKDLSKVLNIPSDKTKSADGYKQIMTNLNKVQNITLELANKVYIMDGYKMKASFKQVAEDSFLAGFQNLNFAQNGPSAKTINTWVESKTNNKIKDLITPDSLDGSTRMVLVNAIYFKGDWKDKFDEKRTVAEKFHTSKTTDVDCQMMHRTGKYFYADLPELSATALKIEYMNKDFSLVVILPNDIEGISDLEKAIKDKDYDLTKVTENMMNQEVVVSLPRFKIETTMDLNGPLERMGLGNMFSDSADFSGLIDSPEALKVSKVIQKAFIEVNEKGAEAAAATAIGIVALTSIVRPVNKILFKADHPFVFVLQVKIEDGNSSQSNTVLFNGKVVEPKQ